MESSENMTKQELIEKILERQRKNSEQELSKEELIAKILERQNNGKAPSVSSIAGQATSDLPAGLGGAFGRGAAQGAVDIGSGALNLASYPFRKIAGAITGNQYSPMTPPQLFRQEQNYPEANAIGRFLGPGLIPGVGPATRAIGGTGRAIEGLLPGLIGQTGRGIARGVGEGSAIGGAYGAINAANQPDENILRGFLSGSTTGAALGGIPGAIGASRNIPQWIAKSLGGKATPEEIKRRLESIPEGLKVPLGEAIDSEMLQGLQKGFLANSPLSNMHVPYHEASKIAKEKMSDILEDLRGGNASKDIPSELFEKAKENYFNTKQEVDSAYKKFGDLADKRNVPFIPSDTLSVLKSQKEKIEKEISRSPSRKANWSPIIKDLDVDIERLSSKSKNKDKITDFKSAEEYRQSLNKRLNTHNDKEEISVFSEIKNAFDRDLEKSAQVEPDVLSHLKSARKAYSEKIIPFEKTMSGGKSKFIQNVWKANPDTASFLSDYIKTPKGIDEHKKLQNLMKILPDEQSKKLAALDYFSTGFEKGPSSTIEEINPKHILSKYNSLSENQKEILFGNHKKSLDQISSLEKIMAGVLDKTFIEKTGSQVARIAPTIAAISAPVAGFATAGIPGAIRGAGEAGGALLGARAASSILKSPKTLEWYLKQIQKPKNNKQSKAAEALHDSIVRGTIMNQNPEQTNDY